MPTSILLTGGVVLTHNSDDHVIPIKADILVIGNKISKIGSGLKAPSNDTIVQDCTNKILCPGFVDTHRHLWQTILKGRHANHMLIDYFPTGNFMSSLHTPEDAFWGQIGGALESIHAGTTTIVDHAHINYSPEHSRAALAGSTASGIRSVFCYSVTPRLASWEPFELSRNLLEPWVIQTLEDLASEAPFAEGRVTLGLGFDATFIGKDAVAGLFKRARSLGVNVITTHYVQHPPQVQLIHDFGVLDESLLFSHASGMPQDDVDKLKAVNAHISSTPSTELQMGMGQPMAFSTKVDIQSHSSLGIDCHSNNSASIVSEMRLLLQSARGFHDQPFFDNGKTPKKVYKTVEEAFNLGTIGGARAAKMGDKIGSLTEGKLADIVVFDAISPSMVAAAQEDPVAAIVLHSSPADIQMVIIDGVIRKSDSVLESTKLKPLESMWADGRVKLQWSDVAAQLLERREIINKKSEGTDWEKAKAGVIKAFGMNPNNYVDNL